MYVFTKDVQGRVPWCMVFENEILFNENTNILQGKLDCWQDIF